MKKFKISIGPVGIESVMVGDQDLTAEVSAVQIVSADREVTELILQCHGPVEIEGEGSILIARPGALAEAIQTLDPKKVEEEALNRGGWGQSKTLTENVIDVIVEKLNALGP